MVKSTKQPEEQNVPEHHYLQMVLPVAPHSSVLSTWTDMSPSRLPAGQQRWDETLQGVPFDHRKGEGTGAVHAQQEGAWLISICQPAPTPPHRSQSQVTNER